jgi:hypothetical protein
VFLSVRTNLTTDRSPFSLISLDGTLIEPTQMFLDVYLQAKAAPAKRIAELFKTNDDAIKTALTEELVAVGFTSAFVVRRNGNFNILLEDRPPPPKELGDSGASARAPTKTTTIVAVAAALCALAVTVRLA